VIRDIFELYDSNPELYDMFSNDRDFKKQCGDIIKYLDYTPLSVLELMAGPARHSVEFVRLGVENVVALDASSKMKEYAIEKFSLKKEKYITGLLPSSINNLQSQYFDCILLLRYGIGYLDGNGIIETIRACLTSLTKNGRIVIELHRFDYLATDLSDLDIKIRTCKDKNGNVISVEWPMKKPDWDRYGQFLKMDVSIKKENASEKIYQSKEYIYNVREIQQIVSRLGGIASIINNDLLPSFGNGSNFIEIRMDNINE